MLHKRPKARPLSIIVIMNVITTTLTFSDPTEMLHGKICSTMNFILNPLSCK